MEPATRPIAEECLRRAVMLLNDRKLAEAATLLQEAERAGADADECASAQWYLAMLRGEFADAWHASDGIRARRRPDPHRFWNGESLRGQRVMIRCLHGFGDAVQMLRLLPLVRAMAVHVTVQVAPAFVPLARCLPGANDVITWEESGPHAAEPRWDVQVEVMELPYVLRLELAQLPYRTSYLRLPAEALREAECALRGVGKLPDSAGKKAGLVWAAGSWNPSRSVPVTYFTELLRDASAAEIEFWSLQGPGASAEAAGLFEDGVLRDGSKATEGVVALAATVAAMNLVITVDTFAAHMAGALGVPVWVLLEERADWRWMVDREDSPWYPSMRLFRCSAGRGLAELLRRVRKELAARFIDA